MKLITCASYYGSGSSALTDLVAEYSNVKDLSDFEFRFMHQLDGIADLEYHLVKNHHRMNSGHALKRFERLMNFYEGNRFSRQYSRFFSKNVFRDLTKKYIDSLNDFTYPGWQFYDLYDKGKILYYLYQFLNHLYRKINKPALRIMKNEIEYCSHPSEEKFLACTREYTHSLFEALNKKNAEYVEIDQIVPATNIDRILKYVKDDVFVFIVDRDPRDIYLLEKYYWKDGMCPTDVDLYCKWFRYARESGHGTPNETERIIKLRFEDLIYKYDETVARVEAVTGLNPKKHERQFEKMNPLRSVNNTQLWRKHMDNNIEIIKERLPEYLYPFDEVSMENIKGKKISINTPF